MKILVVDNNIDKLASPLDEQGSRGCADFRRYLKGEVLVRRGPDADLPPDPAAFTHIILSGSKTSCLDSSPWVLALIDFVGRASEAGVPLLGVCYGHQIVARAFAGEAAVRASATPEIGWVEVRQTAENPLFKGLPDRFYTFQSHVEEVGSLPAGFRASAESDRCLIQAFHHEELPLFGVQFHPERNAQEGQASLDRRKKTAPKDCIFNDGRADLFTENVAIAIFGNFLDIKRKRG